MYPENRNQLISGTGYKIKGYTAENHNLSDYFYFLRFRPE